MRRVDGSRSSGAGVSQQGLHILDGDGVFFVVKKLPGQPMPEGVGAGKIADAGGFGAIFNNFSHHLAGDGTSLFLSGKENIRGVLTFL